MNRNAALNLLLEGYSEAVRQPFSGNPVAEFIRREVPAAIEQIMGDDAGYLIRGSPGQGHWARVPWVAVFNRFITETAQDGF